MPAKKGVLSAAKAAAAMARLIEMKPDAIETLRAAAKNSNSAKKREDALRTLKEHGIRLDPEDTGQK